MINSVVLIGTVDGKPESKTSQDGIRKTLFKLHQSDKEWTPDRVRELALFLLEKEGEVAAIGPKMGRSGLPAGVFKLLDEHVGRTPNHIRMVASSKHPMKVSKQLRPMLDMLAEMIGFEGEEQVRLF